MENAENGRKKWAEDGIVDDSTKSVSSSKRRNVNKETLRLPVLLPFPILNFKTTRLSRHIINTSFIVD